MGVKVIWHKRRRAWVVYINSGGTRKSKGFPDKPAALKFADAMRQALARKEYGLPAEASETTLDAFAASWLASTAATTLKPSTLRFYRDHLRLHVLPCLGRVAVSRLTRADVKALIQATTAKGLGPTSIAGAVRTLSTILSEAVDEGRLAANPALRPGRLARAMRDPNKPKRDPVDPYTADEAAALVETARARFPEWHVFILTALRTGMRMGELRALRWGDIDWRGSSVQVARNFVLGAYTAPKSGKGRRVDLSQQLRAALRLWRRQQRAAWLAKGKPLPDLVFPNTVGRPHDETKIRRAVTAVVRAADVRERGVVHVFRHTFATLLLAHGAPITYVQNQLGHSSIQLTVDVYGSKLPRSTRREVDALDANTGRVDSNTGIAYHGARRQTP